MGVLWDIMRGWVKLHPVRTPKEGSPAHVLLKVCVLQCVAVCRSVSQLCYSVLQCAAVCRRVLQCVAVFCSLFQCVAVWCSVL